MWQRRMAAPVLRWPSSSCVQTAEHRTATARAVRRYNCVVVCSALRAVCHLHRGLLKRGLYHTHYTKFRSVTLSSGAQVYSSLPPHDAAGIGYVALSGRCAILRGLEVA